jgi:transcriptional antiterminator RfaH
VSTEWYLLRTKAGKERIAHDQLSCLAVDTLLPLVKVPVRRWGRMVESVIPLFPCYMFGLFEMEREYNRLRYTRGLVGVVSFGGQPAVVPAPIISGLKQRCAGGPVQLPKRPLRSGERVTVVDGPLREFEGIFERYLSGPERIAILLSVMGAGARVVLNASMVVPAA